ncbi:lytic transglycosylase domain-containing protein [Roseococcus sp. SDR]|uniref:lytic transglycosylase domain-containing protein n=1 Tax=Roseococcus sp. SDR TaxID=2835532 RepID=UPI0020BDAFAB|nr:lytic transglycosylase domain-containing protein [Roseococcus sp. SDR]
MLVPLLLMLALDVRAQAIDPTVQCRAAIARAEQDAQIPAGLLQAIGRVESGRRNPETGTSGPWPWTINAEGRGHFFPDKAAAIAAVRELQARGVRVIDVGCMQVNLHHHPRAFASLDEAFDPISNARYAAQFLTQLQAARGDWMVAAGHYHSHTPDLAQAYRARVQAALPAAQARAAEDRALVGLNLPRQVAMGTPSGLSLSNREDRAQILPASGGAGRGLDAYRANPVPITGRPVALLPSHLVRR